MTSVLLIGLTGGIGSGKSTVAGMLAEGARQLAAGDNAGKRLGRFAGVGGKKEFHLIPASCPQAAEISLPLLCRIKTV